MWLSGPTTLAAVDLGDLIGVIVIISFAVLSWLGKWAKNRQKPDEEPSQQPGHVHEIEPAEVFEDAEPVRPPPRPEFLRPRQLPVATPVIPPPPVPIGRRAQPVPIRAEAKPTPALPGRRARPKRQRPAHISQPEPAVPKPISVSLLASIRGLKSRAAMRRAIVMAEILAPPLGLREKPGYERDLSA